MKFTQALIPTLKEDPSDAEAVSHKFLVRGGFIRKLTAGVYTYLPLGLKVLNKVEGIIRGEMDKAGALEVLLPALQPLELWKESGRYEALGEDMIQFKDRSGKCVVLGPTHEEVITDLVKHEVKSYKELPKILYQIQTKFRDELRPRFGLVRGREFIMKDAYSFDKDKDGLGKSYQKMYDAYCRIMERLELPYIAVEADTGFMGGDVSHEFMVPSESGEDIVVKCERCKTAISKDAAKGDKCLKCGEPFKFETALEIGHVFKLGIKYSKALGCNFLDENGKELPMVMGCYGIGVSRIIAALVEKHNDQFGIVWPRSVAPYQVIIVLVNSSDDVQKKAADAIYDELCKKGIDVLYDDRNERAGVKFKDADLIGIPIKIVVGEKIKEGMVEVSERRIPKEKLAISPSSVLDHIKKIQEKT